MIQPAYFSDLHEDPADTLAQERQVVLDHAAAGMPRIRVEVDDERKVPACVSMWTELIVESGVLCQLQHFGSRSKLP